MLQRITNHLKKLGLARRAIRRPSRRLTLERLESRSLFAGLPFGAAPEDTGEFMLGRIAVTPVFL